MVVVPRGIYHLKLDIWLHVQKKKHVLDTPKVDVNFDSRPLLEDALPFFLYLSELMFFNHLLTRYSSSKPTSGGVSNLLGEGKKWSFLLIQGYRFWGILL